MEMMKGSDIDFGRTVVLEEDPGIKLDGTGSGQAKITHYDASRIDVSVTTDKPGILLLSEIWYPAWHVTIDGAEVASFPGGLDNCAVFGDNGNMVIQILDGDIIIRDVSGICDAALGNELYNNI